MHASNTHTLTQIENVGTPFCAFLYSIYLYMLDILDKQKYGALYHDNYLVFQALNIPQIHCIHYVNFNLPSIKNTICFYYIDF